MLAIGQALGVNGSADCEAAAAAMLLQWEGVEVSKEEVAAAVPREPMPSPAAEAGENEDEQENMIGSNPHEAFIGYDEENVYIHDPYSGEKAVYERAVFRDRWERMGSRAVSETKDE